AYLAALQYLGTPASPGYNATQAALVQANGFDISPYGEGVLVGRGKDVTPKDDGQWGIAVRYMFEPLDTEFGAYFMNYHSRLPIFSGEAGPLSAYRAAGAAGHAAGAAVQSTVAGQGCSGAPALWPGGVPSTTGQGIIAQQVQTVGTGVASA